MLPHGNLFVLVEFRRPRPIRKIATPYTSGGSASDTVGSRVSTDSLPKEKRHILASNVSKQRK